MISEIPQRSKRARRVLANKAPAGDIRNLPEAITPGRVEMSIKQRFNPIRQLTPELLATQLEQMTRGYLSPIMRTWEAMERRDDRLSTVAPKAKKALARYGFEVLALDDSPEAAADKETLEYFYNNCTCQDAYDENRQGGFSMLVRTMAHCIGQKYAVHEILWQPRPSGLTATFRHAPGWFFENLTGRLRFLQQDFDYFGVEMDPAQWLTTVGDGVDEACSVAYMFKHLPRKDWLNYSEKFGFPGILGKTTAAKGSDQWNAMIDAVKAFANDFAAVCNAQDAIELIKADGGSNLPFEPIINAMDKAMTLIWRGADLGTQAHSGGGHGTGASLQEDETATLDADRAQELGETLTIQIDRRVIAYTYGREPRAYVKLKVKPRRQVTQDLSVIQALVPMGVPFAISDILERMDFSMPKDGEALLVIPDPPEKPVPNNLGNAKRRSALPAAPKRRALDSDPDFKGFLDQARELYARKTAEDLAPLREALANVLEASSDEELQTRMQALTKQWPKLAKQILGSDGSAEALYQILSTATANQVASPHA